MAPLPPLSPDQELAFNLLRLHVDSNNWMTTLGGYAGTGKTTLLRHLMDWLARERPRIRPVFVSYTGKAVSVLKSKGIQAQTIHSLIYNAIEDPDDGSFRFVKKTAGSLPYNMVINDEASMTNKEIFDDLRHVIPEKALFVGDHGQLPPVTSGLGKGFNLMKEPEILLEKIHRQAEASPILALAHTLRNNRNPRPETSDGVITERITAPAIDGMINRYVNGELDQIIVATNQRRAKVNEAARKLLGHKARSLPVPGERIVILNNNRERGLFNGMVCQCVEATPTSSRTYFEMTVRTDEGMTIGPLTFIVNDLHDEKPQSYDPTIHYKGTMRATFAHAMTCHKAQGSEWDRVGVIAERMYGTSPARWGYTAVTRAAVHCHYLSPVLA